MSKEPDTETIAILSRQFAATMRDHNFDIDDGTCCLALAYAQWFEWHPETSLEMLRNAVRGSQRTTREAFGMLRAGREAKDRLLAASHAAVNGL
jgi:hypothetical protein